MQQWNEVEAVACLPHRHAGARRGRRRRARSPMAREVAGRSDLVIFVVDGDMTETELDVTQDRACRRAGRSSSCSTKPTSSQPRSVEQLLKLRLRQRRKAGILCCRHVLAVARSPGPRPSSRSTRKATTADRAASVTRTSRTSVCRLWEILDERGQDARSTEREPVRGGPQ